ncbi:homeobox protein VENTX [Pelodytes ibericus]
MEKRSYSVEWLSESSQKEQPECEMDLLQQRLGYTGLKGQRTHSAALSAGDQGCASTTCFMEKENYDGGNVHPGDVMANPRTIQPMCRESTHRVLMGVSDCTQSPVKEDEGISDVDSLKSAGSTSEDDGSSSRSRTKFTPEQLQELEKTFKVNRYIGSSDKKRLSRVLKLSETQIKTWFQNRRMKYKRQNQDARVDAFFSRLYAPYYGFQDYPSAGCPVQPDLAVSIPPTMPAMPFTPVHQAVRPGLHPPAPIFSPPNFGSYPCTSMLLPPALNEPVGQRFHPY